jgi:hypothetical protein
VEAGSAGEQPARNSLFDWDGQKRLNESFSLFLFEDHPKSLCLTKPKPGCCAQSLSYEINVIKTAFY